MECTCFTGYCAASDAADKAELESLEWEASGMADREAYGVTLISEGDLPIGTYEDDIFDIGIALDRYIRGIDY